MKKFLIILAGSALLSFYLSASPVADVSIEDQNPDIDNPVLYHMENYKTETYDKEFYAIAQSTLEKLNRMLAEKPDNEWTYIQRGWLYISMGELDNAVADFKKSISIKPTPSAYMGMGMAYNISGKTDMANQSYLNALKVNQPNMIEEYSQSKPD